MTAGLEHYLLSHPQADRVHIFEMGFGTGLNAWLAFRYANTHPIAVLYTAIEKYPLTWEEMAPLPYSQEFAFSLLHSAPWEQLCILSDHFTLCKQQADLLACTPPDNIDVVYFDAFSPNVQPDLWSAEVFTKLFRCMSPGAVLVTYSSKGSVKQALRDVGFELQRLKGSGGKRHMLRAVRPKV